MFARPNRSAVVGRQVDAVAVASAPAEVQRRRVLARPAMDEIKLAAILARQVRPLRKGRVGFCGCSRQCHASGSAVRALVLNNSYDGSRLDRDERAGAARYG